MARWRYGQVSWFRSFMKGFGSILDLFGHGIDVEVGESVADDLKALQEDWDRLFAIAGHERPSCL